MKLYHGTFGSLEVHEGQCWALVFDVAADYASDVVYSVDVDLSGLKIVSVDVYDDGLLDDREDRLALAEECSADIAEYEDFNGTAHTTLRLISDAAVARFAASEISRHEAEYEW